MIIFITERKYRERRAPIVKKRLIVCGYILILLALCKPVFNYIYNNIIVNEYNNGNYEVNADALQICNWIQPYIAYYNNGNIYYQNSEYEAAIAEYREALDSNPPRDKECSVRINLALAMVKTLNEDYSSEDNIEYSINTLKEARNVLLEEECATENGDGHSETAEKLKSEIEKMLSELEKNTNNNTGKENEDPKPGNEEKKEDSYEENIKNVLLEQQAGANEERNKTFEWYEEFNKELNFDPDHPIW